MIDYGRTRSTVRPEAIEITSSKVFIYSDIQEITVTQEDTEETMFEFDLVEYDKDEYITMMSEQNQTLEEEVTSTQIALCEVYEMLG